MSSVSILKVLVYVTAKIRLKRGNINMINTWEELSFVIRLRSEH